MAKLYKCNRLLFPTGGQKVFLQKARGELGLSWKKIAQLLGISKRTLSDWKREKFTITSKAAKFLALKARLTISYNAKMIEPFWYTSKGARAGGLKVYRKYGLVGGDPDYRKSRWRLWWETKGRYQPHPIINVRKSIKKPQKSAALAEFIGILMGDGGISKNQVVITQHHIDDKDYCDFIIKLAKKLFDISPSIYHRPKFSVNNIVISRVELVVFLNSMGLPVGNKVKQRLDIPKWIKNKHHYMLACVRGLIDTDGSVFCHSYKVAGKTYHYKKISFSSHSKPLLSSVYYFLKKLNLSSRITKNNFEIRMDDQNAVKDYFRIIGSHNAKHLNGYQK